MQEKLFNMLFEEDEITWQTMIFELVKSEEMDPWDINLKDLSTRFLLMVKDLKKFDFRISGKVILAAAILLRIKSSKLLDEDITQLNQLIAMTEINEDDIFEEIDDDYDYNQDIDGDKFKLIPRTPQPRKRKVSVFDLVEALNKALDVKKRRKKFVIPQNKLVVPEKTKDISVIILEIYEQIKEYFKQEKIKTLQFSQLIESDDKADKVYTFIPLLYLDNQRKIDLMQESHLEEINICLNK
jgi:segregation and condensation protein A